MNTAVQKAARERRVVLGFIPLSGLAIDPESVESRPPPEPDILCVVQGEGLVAFELVEICDPAIAATVTEMRERGGVKFVRSADTSQNTVLKKLRKQYDTPHPIELLCYTSGRTVSPDDVIISYVRDVLRPASSCFRRIW